MRQLERQWQRLHWTALCVCFQHIIRWCVSSAQKFWPWYQWVWLTIFRYDLMDRFAISYGIKQYKVRLAWATCVHLHLKLKRQITSSQRTATNCALHAEKVEIALLWCRKFWNNPSPNRFVCLSVERKLKRAIGGRRTRRISAILISLC